MVVELIGGSDGPARALVEAAIAAGKPVVTANKALLAVHGAALAAAAEAARRAAGVRGGGGRRHPGHQGAARGPRRPTASRRIAGILNGTCNYILTQMRERAANSPRCSPMRRSWVTPRPIRRFDIDGIDAAHKLAILAALAFGRPVAFDAVHVEGIRRISALDIAFASELGYRIKLLGIARQTEAGIEARVHPCMVPQSAPIARVDGVFNAVVAEGDFVGRVMLEGRGAGAGPTASAVVADLIDIARNRATPVWGAAAGALSAAPSVPMTRAFWAVLYAPDGGGPARRHCRCHGGAARSRDLAGIDAATRPQPRRGGAGGAGDA